MKVCPEKNWESYAYSTGSGVAFAGFHTDSDKIPQTEFPLCGRVIIKIKRPTSNGGPARDEAETLWALEDSLVAALEEGSVECLLLGRLTYKGDRELVFQLRDWESFRPAVGKWMEDHGDYEVGVSEHDGWNFFFDCVWPSREQWQCIFDRRVVDSLKKSGSDPEKEHSLEFVFYGDVEALNEMMRVLLERSYSVVDLSTSERRLVMAKKMRLNLSAISKEALDHLKEADRLGIEYDGWGCLAVE